MTADQARRESANRWMEKAMDALANARESASKHPAGSINRSYYACFYAASAVLIMDGRHFVKHKGVRSALHEHFVRTGRVSKEIGKAYDTLMETRLEADYTEETDWTPQKSEVALEKAARVVAALRSLLPADLC